VFISERASSELSLNNLEYKLLRFLCDEIVYVECPTLCRAYVYTLTVYKTRFHIQIIA